MWNGLKTAVAGPYLGVTTPSVRGGLLIPSLQPLSGRLFVGRAPVVLTFVPTHSSSLGASGQCIPPPAPTAPLLQAWRTWVGAHGSVRALGLRCPGWRGCAGAGSRSHTQTVGCRKAGGSDAVIYGSACPTSPRSSFNRCSQGQETERRRPRQGVGVWGGTEASLLGLRGRLTTGRRLKAPHIHPSVRAD